MGLDRPKNARIAGFALYGSVALILLPLLFSDPVDPRSTIQSRFAQSEGDPVVVSRKPTQSPVESGTVLPAKARPQLPVGNPAAVKPQPAPAQPTAKPAPRPTAKPISKPKAAQRPVVTPAPTRSVAAPKPADMSKPAWRLQLASYSDQASAERFVKRLREDGLEPRVIGAKAGARRVWRVSVEFRATRADANQLKQKIDKRYRISALLQPR